MAVAADPTNAEALDLEDPSSPDRLERVRRAAAAHPDDPRIFRLLGHLLNDTHADSAEREKVNRQAVKLDPSDPTALNNLAWFLVEARRPTEALPFALRAVKRAPQSAAIIDTYAMALFYAGRCQSAITHQRRALELLREGVSPSFRDELRAHLSQMEGSCPEAKAAR
jgi:Flp pilus assembly protein TadD